MGEKKTWVRILKKNSRKTKLKIKKNNRNIQINSSGIKALRDRMDSVKNTKKITDAMKLVAAAKVRRAQEAVINGRPFSENLVKILYGLNQRLVDEDVDSPLTNIRYVKSILLVIIKNVLKIIIYLGSLVLVVLPLRKKLKL